MGTTSRNISYFTEEQSKNRDSWKHSDGSERQIRIQNVKNPYMTAKFDDVIRYKAPTRLWTNADGEEEFENEDSVEYESEQSDPTLAGTDEFEAEELPKFRQLVRAKKLEFKAQYGKAHFGTTQKTVPVPSTCYKTVSVPYPCPTWNNLGKICYKNSNVPYPCTKNQTINVPVWIWGWRKKWREFKQAGGLAQLKMVSKGMAPLVPPTNTTTPSPTNTGSGGPGRGRTGVSDGGKDVGDLKLDLGDGGTQTASLGKNVIGTVLVLGLVFAAIKMMK